MLSISAPSSDAATASRIAFDNPTWPRSGRSASPVATLRVATRSNGRAQFCQAAMACLRLVVAMAPHFPISSGLRGRG